MYHLQVSMEFAAPIDRVFDAVSDHETFLTDGETTCRLVREGTPDRNGMGALREVRSGSLLFREEIIQFDRPSRYDYVIVSLKGRGDRPPPIKHERGWLSLEAIGARTRVEWHTKFSVTIPLVGWLLERFTIARMMKPKFTEALQRAKERVEKSPG